MNKFLPISFVITTTLTLTGCEGLKDVNSVLSEVNSTLSSITNTSNSSSNGGRVYVTQQAKASTQAAMSKAHVPSSARQLFNSASSDIAKVIELSACGASSNYMRAYTDPNANSNNFVRPSIGMNYHKSGCLSVLRINKIEKKSKNAVKLYVDFISPQSDETSRKGYTAIQQPDGEWLFDWHPW